MKEGRLREAPTLTSSTYREPIIQRFSVGSCETIRRRTTVYSIVLISTVDRRWSSSPYTKKAEGWLHQVELG